MNKEERVARAQELSKELYDLYVGVPIALRNAVWAIDPEKICSDWHAHRRYPLAHHVQHAQAL